MKDTMNKNKQENEEKREKWKEEGENVNLFYYQIMLTNKILSSFIGKKG